MVRCPNCGKKLGEKMAEEGSCPYCGHEFDPVAVEEAEPDEKKDEGAEDEEVEEPHLCDECAEEFEEEQLKEGLCAQCRKELAGE